MYSIYNILYHSMYTMVLHYETTWFSPGFLVYIFIYSYIYS